jgi:hypothetical protein
MEPHLPYTEYGLERHLSCTEDAWNGTSLVLRMRGTALTLHGGCVERHLPCSEDAWNGTYLALRMRGTALPLH